MIQIRVLKKYRKNIIIMSLSVIVSVAVIFGTASMQMAKSQKGMTCAELAALSFSDVTISSTELVPAGQLVVPGSFNTPPKVYDMPEYCKVAATLKPRSDSEIKMQLWLPTGWNGYYMTAGGSGWAGDIQNQDMIPAVQNGFATMNTDTGHSGGAGTWIFNEDKLQDYAGRAIHESTVLSKKITKMFYGKAPKASFMVGCSLGGLQTMKAIQEYPYDFNAVVAGSPHFAMTRYNASQVWPGWLVAKDSEKTIPSSAWSWIHEAVLDKCDGSIDGLKDGLVDDPMTCDFDPYSLVCELGQTEKCLTEKQAGYLKQIYDGPVYQDTGELINRGLPIGAEAVSTDMSSFTPNPKPFFFDLHKWLYFGLYNYLDCVNKGGDPETCAVAPNAKISDLTYTDDIRWTEENINPLLNAEDPDLKQFFKHGGKLIMWVGTGEFTNFGEHVAYLNKVRRKVGSKTFNKSVRLFVVPGMGHCGGGACAADTFDKYGAILDWYENGEAPNVLDASHVVNGEVTFTRPLCAYPEWARYKGTGDPTLASSFECVRVDNPWLSEPHGKHNHHDGHKR